MTTITEQVERAADVREALLAIAAGLDAVLDTPDVVQPVSLDTPLKRAFDVISNLEPDPEPVTIGDDGVMTVPSVAPDVRERRVAFAQDVLQLNSMIADDSHDWCEAYGEGGALWLYNCDRDLVMQYPYEVRQALVADVEMVNAQAAQEVGRDILKAPPSTGIGDGMRA